MEAMSPTLTAGRLRLALSPEAGGSIARFDALLDGGAVSLLRPADAAALAARDATRTGCFPMVPYSGRIADGRLATAQGWLTLPANHPRFPVPIHGQGWIAPWQVAEQSASHAVLVHDWAGETWPFAYRATQRFALTPQALTVTLRLENRSRQPMPAGLGLHPYFPRSPRTRLTATVERVWINDERTLPRELVAVPPAWRFDGRAVDAPALDNCFAGWDGEARIDWPETGAGLIMTADAPCGHLVVYVPPGADFLCVEPVSHASGAFALAAAGIEGTGARTLAPGDSLETRVTFTPILPA